MTAGDVLRTGALGLRTRRARAALSALGIAIGVASMVAVLGISESSKADLLAELDKLGTNLLRVAPGQGFLGEEPELPESAAAMIARGADRPIQLPPLRALGMLVLACELGAIGLVYTIVKLHVA